MLGEFAGLCIVQFDVISFFFPFLSVHPQWSFHFISVKLNFLLCDVTIVLCNRIHGGHMTSVQGRSDPRENL